MIDPVHVPTWLVTHVGRLTIESWAQLEEVEALRRAAIDKQLEGDPAQTKEGGS